MTVVLIGVIIFLSIALLAVSGAHLRYRRRGMSRLGRTGARRILFPYVADGLSRQTLDAALRLASAEDATLVPVFLARVPLHLPIDTPCPRQSAVATALQDAIEHTAAACGISIDARIECGRTYRHALRQTITNERFDRVVLAASPPGHGGLNPDDIAWVLAHAPGEIIVLRPGTNDHPLTPRTLNPGRRPPKRTRQPAPSTSVINRQPTPAQGSQPRDDDGFSAWRRTVAAAVLAVVRYPVWPRQPREVGR
jgi:hypothetical protein